jgi:hypothetical protein
MEATCPSSSTAEEAEEARLRIINSSARPFAHTTLVGAVVAVEGAETFEGEETIGEMTIIGMEVDAAAEAGLHCQVCFSCYILLL